VGFYGSVALRASAQMSAWEMPGDRFAGAGHRRRAGQRTSEVMNDQVITCTHCHDVIGIYEPLVVMEGERVRQTSRAAEPELVSPQGMHFHRDCYEVVQRRERAAAG
jgi:hypothetical protein